ncbi:MAG: hypothetical protein NW204_09475 [Xanthomonadaceae bacterium]|nr:hypothetical protein [Xanthomonadaceae bacterium]
MEEHLHPAEIQRPDRNRGTDPEDVLVLRDSQEQFVHQAGDGHLFEEVTLHDWLDDRVGHQVRKDPVDRILLSDGDVHHCLTEF